MDRSNVIGILSGKGGVGKTTLVANIGTALAMEFKKKALVVDSNVKTSHLALHFGVYDEFPVTLREVLANKVPPMHAIYVHPASGLRMLPAPMRNDSELQRLDDVINSLRSAYDLILVDCAPGLGSDVIIAAKAIDRALIVTTPDLPAFTDALKTMDLMKRLGKDILGIVLNRVRGEKYELTREEIEQACGHRVIAVIPETAKIPESIAAGSPLVMGSSSQAVEFKRLAASLIGETYAQPGFVARLAGIFRFFSMDGVGKPPERNGFVREAAAAVEIGAGEEPHEAEMRETEAEAAEAPEDAAVEDDIEDAAGDEIEAVEGIRRGLAAGARLKDVGPYKGYAGLKRGGADAETEMLRKIKAKLRAKLGR